MEERLHGAEGAVEGLGEGGEGDAFAVVLLEDGAEGVGEGVDAFLEGVEAPFGAGLGPLAGAAGGGLGGGGDDEFAAGFLVAPDAGEVLEEDEAGESADPGGEAAGRVELIEFFERADEGFLDDFLAFGGGEAGESADEPEDGGGVRDNELSEGARVAIEGKPEEVGIVHRVTLAIGSRDVKGLENRAAVDLAVAVAVLSDSVGDRGGTEGT